jgi:hypothetical protein
MHKAKLSVWLLAYSSVIHNASRQVGVWKFPDCEYAFSKPHLPIMQVRLRILQLTGSGSLLKISKLITCTLHVCAL